VYEVFFSGEPLADNGSFALITNANGFDVSGIDIQVFQVLHCFADAFDDGLQKFHGFDSTHPS
jgi:hypothetical protein